MQFDMEDDDYKYNCPQLWCSGGSTPTANPPDLQDRVSDKEFLLKYIVKQSETRCKKSTHLFSLI